MAAALVAAALVTLLTGRPWVSPVKAAGLLLAAIVVVPVFLLLRRATSSGKPTRLTGVFVGGFLFKLVVVLAGVWWAVSRAGWDVADFTVSCLAFLFAFQLCEALYFWGIMEQGNTEQPSTDDGVLD